jgi:predicted GIY-YIG superfamily endonuclease
MAYHPIERDENGAFVEGTEIGTVYLLHFSEPFKHAQHYLGWAKDVDGRIAHHRAGTGARLTQVVAEAGIDMELVRTWENVTRTMERRIKNGGGLSRVCPVCKAAYDAANS